MPTLHHPVPISSFYSLIDDLVLKKWCSWVVYSIPVYFCCVCWALVFKKTIAPCVNPIPSAQVLDDLRSKEIYGTNLIYWCRRCMWILASWWWSRFWRISPRSHGERGLQELQSILIMVERLGRQANISLLQSILAMVERPGRQTNVSLLQSILVMAERFGRQTKYRCCSRFLW